jgi:hypothetical protein
LATITKRVDRGIEGIKRYQYWASSELNDSGGAIAQADVFMIEDSLGRPASYFYIETAFGTDLEIRINSRIVTYPLRDARLNWPVTTPNLDSPVERFDTSMAPIVIGADEVWEFQGVMPISDITITTWSAGSFEIFVS